MKTSAPDPSAFLSEVEQICNDRPEIGTLAGGILAGSRLGLTSDSRSFAKMFGIEHALVVREVWRLIRLGLLALEGCDERTRRMKFRPG